MASEHVAVKWAKNFESTNKVVERMRSTRRRLSEYTLKNYCQSVKIFVEDYMKMSDPDQCLKTVLEGDMKKLVDRFIDYAMEERKVAPRTTRNYFFAVKYWLTTNDVDVDELENIDLPSSVTVAVKDRAPTKEELKQILTFANIRDKTTTEIGVSSGLRIGTIASLTWGDVVLDPRTLYEATLHEKDHSRLPALIIVKDGKGRKIKGRSYFTFVTPETKKLLMQYMDWRERQGEIITPESPLIGSVYKTGNLPNAPFGSHISPNSLEKIWARLLEKAGLSDKSGKWNEIHLHTLRKFFRTQCGLAEIDRSFYEFWMGHKGAYLDDSYFRAHIKEHLEEYQKAISRLSIYEEAPTISKEELDRAIVRRVIGMQQTPDQALEELALEHGLTVEGLRNILAKIKPTEKEEEGTLKRHMVVAKPKEEENEDCQKIVCEEELADHLAKGWKVSAVLPSGKIVVEK